MEKVAKENSDAFELIKINIDENREIASQLRIQSIPTVYAFKDKKIVNAFQGVISEKDFIDFIEKSAGKKLTEDMTEFYNEIKNLIDNKNFDDAKEKLLKFFSENKAGFHLRTGTLLKIDFQNNNHWYVLRAPYWL